MARLTYDTEFGEGGIHYEGDRIVRIHLPGTETARTDDPDDPPRLVLHLAAALEAFFAGRACFLPNSALVAAAGTTPLRHAIYRVVAAMPPGATMTYREVAAAVGRPGAARAVGAAMAGNPFPPVIPCHRVVGSDGRLRGYGGGLAMKARLLELEAGGA